MISFIFVLSESELRSSNHFLLIVFNLLNFLQGIGFCWRNRFIHICKEEYRPEKNWEDEAESKGSILVWNDEIVSLKTMYVLFLVCNVVRRIPNFKVTELLMHGAVKSQL